MQENQQHSSVDVFVGVDVGKGHHHAVALDRTGKGLYNKALPNDETKLRAPITELKAHGRLLFVVDQPATIGALPVAGARDEGVLVAYLSRDNPDRLPKRCSEIFWIPSYWEPPVSRSEPAWPHHQLQAYRWTATNVAYSVRNALEDLHTEYFPDQLMPSMNRAVRNSIYQVLLDDPSLGWRLSRMPKALLRATAESGQDLRLPASVG
jgi:Transposase